MANKLSGFYRRAMAAADQLALDAAADLEGLGEEIAVLRLKLRDLMEREPPAPHDEVLEVMDALRLMVVAQHRVGGNAGRNFAENLAALLEDAGVLMGDDA